MRSLRLIDRFLRASVTTTLFRKFVKNRKARRIFDSSIRLLEIAMVAAPLATIAVRTVREIAKPKPRPFWRRMVSA